MNRLEANYSIIIIFIIIIIIIIYFESNHTDPYTEYRYINRQTENRKIYNTQKHKKGNVPCKN